MLKWYEQKGNLQDVVISTKVGIARNIRKYPFSPKISDEQAIALVNEVEEVCKQSGTELSDMVACSLAEMAESERMALAERQVITPKMAQKKQYRGLLMREDESASILINEEDHIMIQTITSGMNAKDAYARADKLDDLLSEHFEYAFDEKYGYLTTCPTNVGTGLSVSYYMFLPALNAAGKITKLISEVGKYGVMLRGMYEEDGKSQASIFQVSNQKTLGHSEKDIIMNLNNIVSQIVKQERMRREYLFTRNFDAIEDQIYRSYGILKYTKQIDAKDAMRLLTQVMLGADYGILKFHEEKNIYSMIMNIQPYILQSRIGKNTGSSTRDRLRAQYMNQALPDLVE